MSLVEPVSAAAPLQAAAAAPASPPLPPAAPVVAPDDQIAPDLLAVIAEAVAVYAAAKAAGKAWWQSKTIWASIATVLTGVTVVILPAVNAPQAVVEGFGIVTMLAGAFAGFSRAVATGPIH